VCSFQAFSIKIFCIIFLAHYNVELELRFNEIKMPKHLIHSGVVK
jgi:hypothetical protein